MMSTVALLEVFDKQTIQTITETYLQRGGVGIEGGGVQHGTVSMRGYATILAQAAYRQTHYSNPGCSNIYCLFPAWAPAVHLVLLKNLLVTEPGAVYRPASL